MQDDSTRHTFSKVAVPLYRIGVDEPLTLQREKTTKQKIKRTHVPPHKYKSSVEVPGERQVPNFHPAANLLALEREFSYLGHLVRGAVKTCPRFRLAPRSAPTPAVRAQTGGWRSRVSARHFSASEAPKRPEAPIQGPQFRTLMYHVKKIISLTEKGIKHACSGLKSSHE